MVVSTAEKAKRRRHRDDFMYYGPRALKIRTKEGTVLPFRMNAAQLYLHSRVEAQLARLGRVRVLIVKGRQQGCSTYTEGRFYWKVTHRKGVQAFILTHMDDATNNLFGMANRYHEHCPPALQPHAAAANAKELYFDKLDSGYKVGTAGSKGVARSSTIQYFHGSEVAYWPNDSTHIAGALQAVPDAKGTEVVLESTANGRKGIFFDMCMAALRGEGEYELIFIPWFWQEEYRKPTAEEKNLELTSEEEQYKERHGLNDEQIYWRRKKIVELAGVHHFRREYPATAEEAFSAEVEGALWTRELIENTRHKTGRSTVPPLKRIVVAVDPSGGSKETNDEVGIVVGGIAHNDHVYILADVSGRYSPNTWGIKAVAQYKRERADRIIGEANFGGDMVEFTIRTVDSKVSYKAVHASRGKLLRAEPVAALYEQGMVHHVGTFIAMEDEMMSWKPGDPSPNRLDANVWVVTELALGHGNEEIVIPLTVPMSTSFPGLGE